MFIDDEWSEDAERISRVMARRTEVKALMISLHQAMTHVSHDNATILRAVAMLDPVEGAYQVAALMAEAEVNQALILLLGRKYYSAEKELGTLDEFAEELGHMDEDEAEEGLS